jgi:hypothetical protein
MECAPCVRVEIESDALPPLIGTGLLIWLPPSKNVMLPESVPGVVELTVAVNMTVCPTVEGFTDDTTTVLLVASTICPIPEDVAGANVASPLYEQKIECVPAPSDVVVNVALPPLNVTGAPRAFPLSRNVTVPVGVPGVVDVIVAVNVTACPIVEGFKDDAIVARVAAPFEAVATPETGIMNGLPGAFVVTNTLPAVVKPVLTSGVGENVMLMLHVTPGPIELGQLLVAE